MPRGSLLLAVELLLLFLYLNRSASIVALTSTAEIHLPSAKWLHSPLPRLP